MKMTARDVEKMLVEGFMRSMGDLPGFKVLIEVAPSGLRVTYTLWVSEGPNDQMKVGPIGLNLLNLGGEKNQEGTITRIVKTTAAATRAQWLTRPAQLRIGET